MSNSARQAAARSVYAVCESGDSLDDALSIYSNSLSDQERSFCRALSYGGVRWYLAYRDYLDSRLKKPFKPKDRILYAVLTTALYQLDDTRHAQHAIVNEAVALSKSFKRQWAAGLVNAVLRTYIREFATRPLNHPVQWIRQAYPVWMVQQFTRAWPEQIDVILEASQARPPMTLRVNTTQSTAQAYLETLNSQNIQAVLCQDAPQGITLTQAMPVESLPGFKTGLVSVQDESAQLAVEMLDLLPGQQVLDACAAPGGKSLHILETEPGVSGLSVLDFPERLLRLRENFKRAQCHATIIEGDLLKASDWSDGTRYDRILLDAPCTGTGIIRRHPDIKFRRQPENGLQFAKKQLELLREAWHLLKPGGKLLYTTCSILPAENEVCVAAFTDTAIDAKTLTLPEKLGLPTAHGRQRLPGQHSGDGFFYALFKKGEI
jgi:16S rRNA (cytosine967-C5)-methyltransferase